MELDVFEHLVWRPFAARGYTSSFWEIHLDTLIKTWIAMAVLAVFVLAVRMALRRPISPFMYAVNLIFTYFMSLIEDSIGTLDYRIFGYVMSIFFFVLFNNIIEVLPFIGKVATSDLNTTFAIAICCFMYVQYQGLRFKGLAYFHKFVTPFFLFLPVNILGQLAKIASLSFRLFGNILAGTIIISLLHTAYESIQVVFIPAAIVTFIASEICGRYLGVKRYPLIGKVVSVAMVLVSFIPGAQLAFCIGEGSIQAYVIGLLTTLYVSSEVSASGGH